MWADPRLRLRELEKVLGETDLSLISGGFLCSRWRKEEQAHPNIPKAWALSLSIPTPSLTSGYHLNEFPAPSHIYSCLRLFRGLERLHELWQKLTRGWPHVGLDHFTQGLKAKSNTWSFNSAFPTPAFAVCPVSSSPPPLSFFFCIRRRLKMLNKSVFNCLGEMQFLQWRGH